MTTISKFPRFQLSIDVKSVYERLIKAAVGETVEYKELTTLISRDIRKTAPHVLYSARKRAEREDHIVFGAVTNIGIRRLKDTEIVDTGHEMLKHIRRTSQRGYARITGTVDFGRLDEAHQVKHNTFGSILGALAGSLHEKKLISIEAKVKAAQKSLPLADTMRAFLE